jgi:SAM-dependent methyltransferase
MLRELLAKMIRKLLKKIQVYYSIFNRKRKLDFVIEFMDRLSISNVLIVGAAQANVAGYGNLIERGIINTGKIVTISGLEDQGYGWPNWISCNGTSLPFMENKFDLVFSNAVIEHVGGIVEQIKFVNEHARVGGHFIITTPNRLFPIESHTLTLFLYMVKTRRSDLFTRLLSKKDLKALLPVGSTIKGHLFSPTFIAHCTCL